MPTLSLKHAAVCMSVLVVTACGDDPVAPPGGQPVTPGINIVAGASYTDTALSRPRQALIVEVRAENGALRPGLLVRFEPTAADADGYEHTMQVAALAGGEYGELAVDTTDGTGRAAALVQMGRKAGEGAVVITVPELGYRETASYIITPGAPAVVYVLPRDSAVYVGASYPIRAGVGDQHGNPLDDGVDFTAGTPGLAVDAGGVLTGTAVGRSYVLARAGDAVDTAWVSVVPVGMVTGYRSSWYGAGQEGLVMLNLDGSGFNVLSSVGTGNFEDAAPSWSPAGSEVVLHHNDRLHTVDLSGRMSRLIDPALDLEAESWAQFSRDGQWIYFGGWTNYDNAAIWRVRADGSGAERIGPGEAGEGIDSNPSPSPDGNRLAYITTRVCCDVVIRVLDLATGVIHALDVPGHTPRWSPTGDWITYYHDDAVRVMRPDGSDRRTISDGTRSYAYGLDWSPDGEWVVAGGEFEGSLDLIHAVSGETLPLAFTEGIIRPAWRP